MPRGSPRVSSRRRLSLLVALLAGALAVSLSLRHLARQPVAAAETPVAPKGWWRLALGEAELATTDREQLARQLSLPYAAGVVRAEGRFGVRAWDRARALDGFNLYVSGHAPEAILMAMDGGVVHRWRFPFERAFPGRAVTNDCAFFRRAALLDDGGLVAIYQGGGVVRLDAESRLVWRAAVAAYNDLWVAPGGERVRILVKEAVERRDLVPDGPLLEDFVVTLDGAGRELARASLLAAFERSAFRGLIRPLGASADIFHSNTLAVLERAAPAAPAPFAPGNLLVSLREIDTLAVLDPAARQVLWARRGPWRGQHEPSPLPDGRLLLFDNLGGGEGLSRVLAVAPESGATESLWPPAGVTFFSRQAGSVARLANGDLLIVESERGAAFEVDPGGRVVWEFRSPHRAGARGELVATLFDLVRYAPTTPFLARLALASAPPQAP